MSPLLREFVRVQGRLMDHGELRAAAEACGLFNAGLPIGWDLVEPLQGGEHYAPRSDGQPAIIVPVFEYGRLIDLAACTITPRRTYSRSGNAAFVGWHAVEDAMTYKTHLHLHDSPIEWLRFAGQGAVVLDWRAARHALADLQGIICTNDLLAGHVSRALRQPLHVPQILVPEAARAAA